MKVLLETHIAKATVGAIAKAAPDIEAQHLARWRDGPMRSASDAELLTACHEEGRVLVTFDLRTIPSLLRQWAAEGRNHSGVIFGDDKTLKPSSPAMLAAALATLVAEIGEADTTNVIRFLTRPDQA